MSGHFRMMQTLEKNWLAVSKLTEEFDQFWSEHSNVLKIYSLMGPFWPSILYLS